VSRAAGEIGLSLRHQNAAIASQGLFHFRVYRNRIAEIVAAG
jgi:hypothetical protein